METEKIQGETYEHYSFVTHTTAGGAVGKKNIKVEVDVDLDTLKKLARGEIQRDINKMCRESDATVKKISASSNDEPFVVKVSDLSKGTAKVNYKANIKDMQGLGMSAEDILEALLK